MLYLISMKKVMVKYESYIFQNEHVDRFSEETSGELIKENDYTKIVCLLKSETGKEKTIFCFKDDSVTIERPNYVLEFNKSKMIEFENKTEYGSIMFVTKLKKYLKLDNQFVINYELFIGDDSVGSYVLKISYEEMN